MKAQVSVIFCRSDDLGDVEKMINALLSLVCSIVELLLCKVAC